jgi:hypothetical protein
MPPIRRSILKAQTFSASTTTRDEDVKETFLCLCGAK